MSDLSGKRVLVVEDEPIIAMTVEDTLIEFGATVIGPATSVEDAIKLVDASSPYAALLDLNLNGKRSDAVADLLVQRSVPFVFATGYGMAPEDSNWPGVAVLQKPYNPEQLIAALTQAILDRR